MTKSKRQLRAEAVGRLEEWAKGVDWSKVLAVEIDAERLICLFDDDAPTCSMEPSFTEPRTLRSVQEWLCSACGEYSYTHMDDAPPRYCSCCGAKVRDGEPCTETCMDADSEQRNPSSDNSGSPEPASSDGSKVTGRDSPLAAEPPEGDAAYLLRKLSMDFKSDVYKRDECEYIDALADMVERDYVPRKRWTEAIRAMKAAQDRMDDARAERDETRIYRDEWKNRASVLEAAYERMTAERDEWRAKAEGGDAS